MRNRLILGDSVKELKKLENNSIDGVVTSPPYDKLRTYENGKLDWNFRVFEQIANELYRVLKDGAVICWVVGDSVVNGAKTLTSFRQALYFQQLGFAMHDVLIYQKTGSGPPHKNRYFNSFEYIFVLSKGKPKTIHLLKDKPNKWAGHSTYGEVTRREVDGTLTKKGKKVVGEFGVRTNVWTYKNGRGQTTTDKIAHGHPAIFPEKLVEDCLKTWTDEGDLILDPFGGSGTTAKISKKLNRDFLYIEKEEKYFEIAKERLRD
ncbi:site-specific DNA-methyltransferase [Streptococcus sanguinis]|jgi:modification methylase bamHII|uniref:DNA-methyltransferase n=1 Tax=Streptococcus sanguinis TaxID=1305 RepID=UPI002283C44E|nr:site-specific DNA-methyltransferase [Streptococcus sanguinis]MCY7016157.1 site-specific DNA-methyltransferase [Streptococcus sanguinis]